MLMDFAFISIFLALIFLTIAKYGINKQKVHELREGEAEIIKEYMEEKEGYNKGSEVKMA